MSETITQGEPNGETSTIEVESGQGGEAPIDEKAIYAAEIAKLEAQEGEDQRRATDFQTIPGAGDNPNDAGQQSDGDEAGDEEGDEQGNANTELSDEEDEQGSEESEVEEKKQRNNWKKKAQDQEKANEVLEKRLADLEAKLSEKPNEDAPPEKKVNLEVPEVGELDKENLSQEVKDLLEYTPGLDKLIGEIAGQQALALIEKFEQDRAKTLHEAEQSKVSQEQETSYWNEMDTWFQGQYPDLTLSEVREDPDFNDWMEYRKNWVDKQLASADRNDVSGAQKIFERYITENDLAQPANSSEGNRKLAKARTPVVGKKTITPKRTSDNLFQDEVNKLKATDNHLKNRYI